MKAYQKTDILYTEVKERLRIERELESKGCKSEPCLDHPNEIYLSPIATGGEIKEILKRYIFEVCEKCGWRLSVGRKGGV